MAEDFLETADRMCADAKLLYEGRRYYNACYLAGYVAECYSKHVLLKVAKTPTGRVYTKTNLRQKFAHDIDALMTEVCSISMNIPAQCRVDFRTTCNALWDHANKWKPTARYGSNTSWADPSVALSYIIEADYIYQHMMHLIFIEGVLPL